MEIGADIARLIIESRGTNIVKDNQSLVSSSIKEVEHVLPVDSIINIRTLLVHEHCQRLGVKCEAAILIEQWRLQVRTHNSESTTKILNPLFLKNAIRSHLHFSQLNSWMTSNGGKLPNDLVFVYRFGCDTTSTGIHCDVDGAVQLEDDLTEKHLFPTVKCGISSFLTVSVKWKKFFMPPSLRNCSSCRKNSCASIHRWMSPMESVKSDIYNATANDITSQTSEATFNEDRFDNDDDEDSSGVFSASNSSSDSALDKFEVSGSERSTKKRSFVDEEDRSCETNAMKVQFVNDEDCSTAKRVKPTEVENLANVLAEASSLTKAKVPIICSQSISLRQSVPRRHRTLSALRFISNSSTVFSKKTRLPLNSSPAPFYRKAKNLKRSLIGSIGSNEDDSDDESDNFVSEKLVPTGAGLLCNFEESILNGRLEPFTVVKGYRLQITASGSFCAPHLTLPVEAFFFKLPDDNAPPPNLGHCSLEDVGRKSYHIPKKGFIQATLFNPQGTVVCLFVVQFDVTEMPPFCQTFLRQRQFFMPPECPYEKINRSWLRYLIHLRLATDRRCRVYIHGNIRILFSQKSHLDAVNTGFNNVENQYELRSFTEMPQKPQFSPRV